MSDKLSGRINPDKCDHCGLCTTPEGHDGCIGTLPESEVMNACCGHGNTKHAYVQFWDSPRISGDEAQNYIEKNKPESEKS